MTQIETSGIMQIGKKVLGGVGEDKKRSRSSGEAIATGYMKASEFSQSP